MVFKHSTKSEMDNDVQLVCLYVLVPVNLYLDDS